LPSPEVSAVNDPSAQTAQLLDWLDRMRGGDRAAREELLRNVCGRLEGLARKMLRSFPAVRRWTQTDDVLQNSLLRLLHSLETVQPASMREFFGLAATQIRRELLDLARHFGGPGGLAANHASVNPDDTASPLREPPDTAGTPDELDRWSAFHEEVDRLPADQREVVSLIFYHGLTRAEAAHMLQVSERTVRRQWRSAMALLHQHLGPSETEV
jgi:RNA polymerase sigma factor (sigma-70 family)